MTQCPHCGGRMWSLDDRYLTCKKGHVMAKDAEQPPADGPDRATMKVVPVHRWRYPSIAEGLLVAVLVLELVEVL